MILNNKLAFHNDKQCIYKYISNSNGNIVWFLNTSSAVSNFRYLIPRRTHEQRRYFSFNKHELLGQKKLIISFSGTASLHFHMPHLSLYSVN